MNIQLLVMVLLLCCKTSYAVEYYRCKGEGGIITFSEKPCGPNAEAKTTRDSYLGGQNRNSNRSAIQQLQDYRKEVRRVEQITGPRGKVNRKKDGPCDAVSSLALRNARISKDVMKCHSKEDVRHIYGEPSSISTWSDKSSYDTRWKYRQNSKQTFYIYFRQGKVTKWNAIHKR